MILDIHSHRSPVYPSGIISVNPSDSPLCEGQIYSVGIHPWLTKGEITGEMWNMLENQASLPQVAMIGEAGIDTLKGGLLFRQMNVFKMIAEMSERVQKPLIIHDVKGHEQIIGIHREMNPTMPWVIHGFRGKPTVAEMLLREGFYLSYGEQFNEESLKLTPPERLLAETDESELDIEEIIAKQGKILGNPELRDIISANVRRLLVSDFLRQV